MRVISLMLSFYVTIKEVAISDRYIGKWISEDVGCHVCDLVAKK